MPNEPVKKTHLRADDDLRLREDLVRYARLLEERSRARAGQATWSDGALSIIEHEYETQPYAGSAALDTMVYIVRGLREIFGQDPVFTWVGEANGMANPQATRINIYNALAPINAPRNPQAPDVIIRCSTAGFPPSMLGNLAGFNMVDGTKTHAGIIPIGCQIEVSASSPATTSRLAEHVATIFRAGWRQWTKFRIFDIRDIQLQDMGTRNNTPQAQNAQSDLRTTCMVGLTMLRAWVTTDRPNPAYHEKARALAMTDNQAPIDGQPPTGRRATDSSFRAQDVEMGLASGARPAMLSVTEFMVGGEDPPAIHVTRPEAPVEEHDD
jgi:hypothetical protein